MPTRPLKPCARPGCRALTSGRYCGPHEEDQVARDRARRAEADARRPTAAQRGYGVDWQALRKVVLARDPICRLCTRKPSRHADHIVPKAQGGRDREANLQGVCHSCHSRKTASTDGGFGNAVVRGQQLRAAADRATRVAGSRA